MGKRGHAIDLNELPAAGTCVYLAYLCASLSGYIKAA